MSVAMGNANSQITVLSPTDQFKGDKDLPNVTYIKSGTKTISFNYYYPRITPD